MNSGFLALLATALVLGLVVGSPLQAAKSRDRNNKPYKVVCYHGTWSVYRPGAGKFFVEDIDPHLCTHLIYGFVGLRNNKIAVLDGYLDLVENWGKGNFKRFNDLKKKNPNLTTILAIGGWNEGSTRYSEMARSQATRKIFIDSVVEMLLKHDFDGLDMDWEYPSNRGGIPEDKQNFVTLLQELRQAFDQHGLLLTAAVSAGKATIDTAYDIPQVSKLLDFVNVMAYDFHGGWEKVTGHNSPLYARPEEKGNASFLNMDWSIKYWIQQGASPQKLVLGMGTYGRAFTLQDPKKTGIGAPAPQTGRAGPFTREPGMLGFNEICSAQKRENWNVVFDPYHLAPYASKDNQWVGYDDVKSIAIKTDYGKKMGLGGAMIWSIETDDFRGECFGQKYPLLTKINEVLGGEIVRPPTIPPTPEPSTGDDIGSSSTTQATTTTSRRPTSAPGDLKCSTTGLFRNPKDCSRYYQCVESGDTFAIIEYECGAGTVFDQINGVCTWPNQVPGC